MAQSSSADTVVKDSRSILKGQDCPICRKKTLALSMTESDVPFFGKILIYTMFCDSCKYHKADVESDEQKKPCRFTFEVKNKDDLNVRVVKSADAVVKIPHIGSIMPGPNAEGYVTNVEGLIVKIKDQVETIKDTEEDEALKKKAKNLLKKIQNIIWGSEKAKIIIEDKTGNSAIISDNAVKEELK